MGADGLKRDLLLAKTAFQENNSELSKKAHDGDVICEPGHNGNMKVSSECMLWGSLEGTFTTLILITVLHTAGVATGQLAGICFPCSAAFALAFGLRDYLRFRSDVHVYTREKRRETWELHNYPAGEINEMIELYESQGVSKPDAKLVIETLAQYKEVFVDLMMMAELHMQSPRGSPTTKALITMSSSCAGGVSLTLLFLLWDAYASVLLPWVSTALQPYCLGLQSTLFASIVFCIVSGKDLAPKNMPMVFVFSVVLFLVALHLTNVSTSTLVTLLTVA